MKIRWYWISKFLTTCLHSSAISKWIEIWQPARSHWKDLSQSFKMVMDFANTDIQVVHFLFAGYSRIRCTVKLFFVVFFFFVCFFLMYTRSKRGNNATMKKKILFSFLWFHRKSDLRLSRVVLAFWEQIPWFGHLGDFAHSSVSPWFRRFRDLWREITVSLAFIAPLYLAPPPFSWNNELMIWVIFWKKL